MDERLIKQMKFIKEIDGIKSVFRKTKLFDGSRYENDAEHSWHFAVMAAVLSEYSNEKIDIPKVVKMGLIHDIPELYCGDIMVYAKKPGVITKEEEDAAKKVFSILPADQAAEFITLWREFEERATPEAKFAAALDRLGPVMQNHSNRAAAWRENNIKAEQVFSVNKRIGEGSDELWDYAKGLIEECVKEGLIK